MNKSNRQSVMTMLYSTWLCCSRCIVCSCWALRQLAAASDSL